MSNGSLLGVVLASNAILSWAVSVCANDETLWVGVADSADGAVNGVARSALGCPGTGDCCTAHGGLGCRDAVCCNFVCGAIPTCCSIGWTTDCADFADSLCDANACAASGCPGNGDCCTSHASRGCNDLDCCDVVCTSRPSCCSSTWSTTCANLAEALCGPLCEAPSLCPGTGDCCRAHGTPSCSDAACCERVCALDAFCCEGEWDDTCAGKANDLCGDSDGTYCLATWCPGEGGPCCEAHGTPGCDRSACCEIVCVEDPFCCANFWYGACPGIVDSLCVATACTCVTLGNLVGDAERVDLRDAAAFQNCFTGIEGGPIDPACACGDDDGDGTVDRADVAAFMARLSGP